MQLPRTALPPQPGRGQSRIWVSSRVTRPRSQIRRKIYRRSDLAESTRKQPESVAHKAEIQRQTDGDDDDDVMSEDEIGLREYAQRRRRRKGPDRREGRGLGSREESAVSRERVGGQDGTQQEDESRSDHLGGRAAELRTPVRRLLVSRETGLRTVEDRPLPEEDRQPAAVFGGGQWKTRALLMKTDRAIKTTADPHNISWTSRSPPEGYVCCFPVFPNLFYSPLPLPRRVSSGLSWIGTPWGRIEW